MLYAKLIYSEKTNKILSLFTTKGKQKVNPFFFSRTVLPSKNGFVNRKYFYKQIVVSLQIKVCEVYVKPLKPGEPVSIVESE